MASAVRIDPAGGVTPRAVGGLRPNRKMGLMRAPFSPLSFVSRSHIRSFGHLPLGPFMGDAGESGHGVDERLGIARRWNRSVEDVTRWMRAAVELVGIFGILAYRCAVEVNAHKEAVAAGIGEKLRIQFPVGRGFCIAAHRAGRCSGIGADLEFALQEVLHS